MTTDEEFEVQVEHAPGPDSTLCDPPSAMPASGRVGFSTQPSPPESRAT